MSWGFYLTSAFSARAAEAAGAFSGTDILQALTTASAATVLGVVVWLFIGGRIHSDSEVQRLAEENKRIAAETAKAVEAARVDLLREILQVRAEKEKAEEQRDAVIRYIQEQLMPLIGNFTSATSSLLPVLQALTSRHGEDPAAYHYRERDDGRR